jgi:hypothetical protein
MKMKSKKVKIVNENDLSPTLTTKSNFYVSVTKAENIKSGMEKLNDDELWSQYSFVLKELKRRNLVRTKNIVGDKGEFLAVNTYNSIPNEPKLQLVLKGTQNVDAISRNGKTYNIKTVTLPNRTTGVFYGLEPRGSDKLDTKTFDYVIVVILDEDLNLKEVLEIEWDTFIKLKGWHSRMEAWNLSINEELKKSARRVFPRKEG